MSASVILLRDVDAEIGATDASIEFAPATTWHCSLARIRTIRGEVEVEYADVKLDSVEAAGVFRRRRP